MNKKALRIYGTIIGVLISTAGLTFAFLEQNTEALSYLLAGRGATLIFLAFPNFIPGLIIFVGGVIITIFMNVVPESDTRS